MTAIALYRAAEQRRGELLKQTRTHVCGECGGGLVLSRIPSGPEVWPWALKCLTHGWRDETNIRRKRSDTERYKLGEALHPAVANRIENILGGKFMETTQLMKMSQTQMVERVKKGKFPKDLTVRDMDALATVARNYGLDPLMNELTVLYGNVYIEVAGRLRKAQDTSELAGVSVRPMTKDERDAYRVELGDFGSHAIVKRVLPSGHVAEHEGWGIIRGTEVRRNIAAAEANHKDPWSIPLVKDPQLHSDKRAKAAALKNGFSIPLPSAENVDLTQPPPTITVMGKDGQPIKANGGTGEVREGAIEGDFREEPDPDDLLAEADAQKEATKAAQPPTATTEQGKAPAATPTGKQEPLIPGDRCFPSQADAIDKMLKLRGESIDIECLNRCNCKPMDLSHKQAAEWIQELDKAARAAKAGAK